MTSEVGTKQCYGLVKAKENIEEAIYLISQLPNTEHISKQLLAVHNQLEGIHELQRRRMRHH